MLRIHKTKEGERLFISQMTDEHLLATINMYLTKIAGYKDALASKISISPFKAALYEVNVEQFAETAKARISSTANGLYPYLAEAMLRKMDFSDKLREVFERDRQEGFFAIDDSGVRMIESNNEEQW